LGWEQKIRHNLISSYQNTRRRKVENEKEKQKKRELTQKNKRKKKKSNGGSKANLHRSLQNFGDLKWHFTSKSSKFDLLIIKSTYKYINLSH
jgi:hypothetical protein